MRAPAQVFFTPLSQALRLIIHLGEPLPEDRLAEFTFDFGTLALFFVLPYALMMWTNGVGASTGMFVPALAVGATGVRAPLGRPGPLARPTPAAHARLTCDTRPAAACLRQILVACEVAALAWSQPCPVAVPSSSWVC